MTIILKWKKLAIEKHFDFRLNGSIDTESNSSYSQEVIMNMVMLCFVMN